MRHKDLNNLEEKTLQNLLNKWSILKHPQGYELVIQDFDKMNLSKVKLTFNIWQQFINTIIKYSICNSNNNKINEIVEKLEDNDVSNGNLCIVLHLFLLM